MEKEMYESLSLNGIDFDAKRAWELLTEKGLAHCRGGGEHTSLMLKPKTDATSHYYRKIEGLPCASVTYFTTFTSGRAFAGTDKFGQYDTTLQDFHRERLDDPGDTTTMRVNKLGTALGNFEAFLVFCTGKGMKGVFDRLRDNLFEGSMQDQFWLPRYLRYVCEDCISVVFKLVNTEKKEDFRRRPTFETVDISEATGVQYLLSRATADLVPSQQMQLRFEREFGGATQRRTKDVGGGNNSGGAGGGGIEREEKKGLGNGSGGGWEKGRRSDKEGEVRRSAQGGVSELPCKAQLLHDLGVKNMEGKVTNGCQVGQCRFKHVDVGTVSKRDMHNYVNGLSKRRGEKGERPAVLSEELAKEVHAAITLRK